MYASYGITRGETGICFSGYRSISVLPDRKWIAYSDLLVCMDSLFRETGEMEKHDAGGGSDGNFRVERHYTAAWLAGGSSGFVRRRTYLCNMEKSEIV